MLREFVYLDEVSVYSLIASRLGAVAAEFTETEAASLQAEVESSVSANAGVARGSARLRSRADVSQESHVLKKAIVQTTFKELYDLEGPRLLLRPMEDLPDDPPTVRDFNDLTEMARRSAAPGWIVDPEGLGRGSLIEVEIELETEAIYQVSALLTSMLDIVRMNPELIGGGGSGELGQISSINRLIEAFLVGLIPVRGRACHFDVVRVGEKDWIVHHALIDQLSADCVPDREPLWIVAVTQESLFWKDIRRILFSKARFRAFGRLAEPGLQDSWTPVKLGDVLSVAAPDLGRELDRAGHLALAAMGGAGNQQTTVNRTQEAMYRALVEYGIAVGNHLGLELDQAQLAASDMPSAEHCAAFGSIEGRRAAFQAMTKHAESTAGAECDPIVAATLRTAALIDAGLGLDGTLTSQIDAGENSPIEAAGRRLLDCEFIALYW